MAGRSLFGKKQVCGPGGIVVSPALTRRAVARARRAKARKRSRRRASGEEPSHFIGHRLPRDPTALSIYILAEAVPYIALGSAFTDGRIETKLVEARSVKDAILYGRTFEGLFQLSVVRSLKTASDRLASRGRAAAPRPVFLRANQGVLYNVGALLTVELGTELERVAVAIGRRGQTVVAEWLHLSDSGARAIARRLGVRRRVIISFPPPANLPELR
jgi:hypothetical protein